MTTNTTSTNSHESNNQRSISARQMAAACGVVAAAVVLAGTASVITGRSLASATGTDGQHTNNTLISDTAVLTEDPGDFGTLGSAHGETASPQEPSEDVVLDGSTTVLVASQNPGDIVSPAPQRSTTQPARRSTQPPAAPVAPAPPVTTAPPVSAAPTTAPATTPETAPEPTAAPEPTTAPTTEPERTTTPEPTTAPEPTERPSISVDDDILDQLTIPTNPDLTIGTPAPTLVLPGVPTPTLTPSFETIPNLKPDFTLPG